MVLHSAPFSISLSLPFSSRTVLICALRLMLVFVLFQGIEWLSLFLYFVCNAFFAYRSESLACLVKEF